MITLLIIGILIFAVKVILLAVKAAWGLTKALFTILGFPILLLVLFFTGLVYVSFPLLLIGLLLVFLKPLKRN